MTKMKAGFAEVDITPKLGTLKGGWWTYLPVKKIVDPLFARAAVFEGDGVNIYIFINPFIQIIIAENQAPFDKDRGPVTGLPCSFVLCVWQRWRQISLPWGPT